MAPKKEKIFNDRERKVFRHYIGRGEVAFGTFFVVFTAAMGAWFFSLKDAYDPAERDISVDVLEAQSVQDKLYRPPVQRWIDPAMASTGAAPAMPDIGIFPKEIMANGWLPGGRVAEFTNDTMYEKIDGQEVQYNQFGCKFLHFLNIRNDAAGVYIDIELYDMDTFSNALGIFAAQRGGDAQVRRLGPAYYYETEVGAMGIVDKFYFKLVGNQPSPVVKDQALAFIKAFSEKAAGESAAAETFALLSDGLGVPFQDIEYVREDVFQFDFCKDFWFGRVAPGSEAKFFIHEAASEDAAAALFDQLLEEQLYDYKQVSRDGNRVVLQHNFLKTFFSLNQAGPYVYGIEGAADADTVGVELERFQKALSQAGDA